MLERALAIVAVARNYIKLLPGSHPPAGTVYISAIVDFAVYGPATLEGFRFAGQGVVKLRDLSVAQAAQIYCQVYDPAKPQPALNIDSVTFAPDAVVSGLRCNVRIRHAHFHRTTAGTSVAVSGGAPSVGGELFIDQSEFDGGTPAVGVNDGSSFHITNTVFRNMSPIYGALGFNSYILPSDINFSTFYNSILKCVDYQGTGTALKVSLRNNVFLNPSGGSTDTVQGPQCAVNYNLIKPQVNSPAVGYNNLLNVDPLFVDATSQDLHLSSQSPAIDAADPSASEMVDYDGTVRPQGTRADMGAFEYKP